MTGLQKFMILLRALGWALVSLVVVVIGFPVGLVLVLLGGLLGVFHINFMTHIAESFLQSVTSCIQYITRKIQALTQKVEASRGQ